jgi:hypothetical protein
MKKQIVITITIPDGDESGLTMGRMSSLRKAAENVVLHGLPDGWTTESVWVQDGRRTG